MDDINDDSLLPHSNFHPYTDNFTFRAYSDDDLTNTISKFSFDDAGSSYKKTPRIFDRFHGFSSSDEGEDEVPRSSNCQRRLDCMLQFLDRRLPSNSSSPDQPLPEFSGSGGGTGIFKTPTRAPVNPNRPPSLEIRPHPLREAQVGRFLRNIVCVDDGNGPQLWAGSECGIRVWDLENDIYGGVEEGQEEGTLRYLESTDVASSVLCMVGDGGNKVVWSGHKDGRIMCWKMIDFFGDKINGSRDGFQEVFSWQAHRGPVLSMVVSSYGDIWSGSDSGAMKVWPWEALEKSLSLTVGESHMASLLLERSYIDMRNQFSQNGVSCNIFTSDVKYLLSDHAGAKVWASSYHSIAKISIKFNSFLSLKFFCPAIQCIGIIHSHTYH